MNETPIGKQIANGISYTFLVIAILAYLLALMMLDSGMETYPESVPKDVAFRENITTVLFLVFIGNLLFGSTLLYFAHQKGRNPVIWFFIGLLIGLIGCLIVWCLPKMKKCPSCMKRVDRRATRCRFCQIDFGIDVAT